MELGGIDLDGLAHELPVLDIPDMVPGRVAQIDADFLAYQTSAERADGTDMKTFEDMKHNAAVAIETIRSLAGAEHVHLHLTASSSDKGGRYDFALLKQYQGNRIDKPKPRYLNRMREHLAQHYHGSLYQTCEADDGMSSAQYKAIQDGRRDLSIIVSKDKDLAMVPGLQLHWDRGTILDADTFGSIYMDRSGSQAKLKGHGQFFFWAQMLMGDTADNISGLPKVNGRVLEVVKPGKKADAKRKPGLCGPAMALQIFEHYEIKSNAAAFALVKALYKSCSEVHPFTNWRDGSPVTWQEAFISEAKLLWMRRVKEDPNDVIKWFKEIQNEV